MSAKSLEAIAGIERDRRRYERAAEFYRKCSPVYVLADNLDRGAEAMVKAAKIMADVNESVTLLREQRAPSHDGRYVAFCPWDNG
mmetsp:Transcript_36716/g.85298  ORF Transcript_36716/g.85298 Transcript_36716/m.85298 type:complete len:85 (-) Transcript_36716:309-563(-)